MTRPMTADEVLGFRAELRTALPALIVGYALQMPGSFLDRQKHAVLEAVGGTEDPTWQLAVDQAFAWLFLRGDLYMNREMRMWPAPVTFVRTDELPVVHLSIIGAATFEALNEILETAQIQNQGHPAARWRRVGGAVANHSYSLDVDIEAFPEVESQLISEGFAIVRESDLREELPTVRDLLIPSRGNIGTESLLGGSWGLYRTSGHDWLGSETIDPSSRLLKWSVQTDVGTYNRYFLRADDDGLFEMAWGDTCLWMFGLDFLDGQPTSIVHDQASSKLTLSHPLPPSYIVWLVSLGGAPVVDYPTSYLVPRHAVPEFLRILRDKLRIQ